MLVTPNHITPDKFVPRPYQTGAINAAVNYFESNRADHVIEVLPTGSGKSVIIANIAKELEGRTIVFQPSKEILEQNYAKYCSYGYKAGIYSASLGQKQLGKVTFATIGSVIRKKQLFQDFKNIIVDECHLVNSKGGQYHEFINSIESCKVLGLTATPYRLSSDSYGAQLKFLTRTRPRIFSDVLYVVQTGTLFNSGFLAKLTYFSFDVIDRKMLTVNSNGTDFTEASLRAYYRKIDFPKVTSYYANRIIAKRKNLLVFCATIADANEASRFIPGSVVLTGETKPDLRARILSEFKRGVIKVLINVGVLTTGFDYPELEAILIARSTMSLAMYYQIVGRVMRIHSLKEDGWVVDIGGNINFFGKIETLHVGHDHKGLWVVKNNGRQLTNVVIEKY